MTRQYAARILVVVGLIVAAVVPAQSVGAATVVKGAGSDSADPLFGVWQKAVAAAPYSTTIDYSADGSGLGRDEFIQGKTDFVVSGIPFTTAEDAKLTTKKKTYVYAPVAGGALAFLYHLNNAQGQPIKGLQLSGATLTKIFTGVITNWDDPEILADNPGVALPPKKITPTVRGQADAATYTATSFFKFSAPSVWKAFMEDPQRGFPDEPRELYPFFAGADSRTSSFAIADVVGASEGGDTRITYVDNAWATKATAAGADIVKVKNVAGKYVLPTPANTAKTLATWKLNDRNLLGVDYVAATDPAAYPVAMVNYLVIPTSGVTPEVAAGIGTFAKYGLETGQAAAAGVGDPVLPAAVVTKSLAVVAAAIPTTTTTTTTSTTAPIATDVSGSDLSNGGGDTGPSLALTGGPDYGLLLGAGGVLAAAGGWLRRRASR